MFAEKTSSAARKLYKSIVIDWNSLTAFKPCNAGTTACIKLGYNCAQLPLGRPLVIHDYVIHFALKLIYSID